MCARVYKSHNTRLDRGSRYRVFRFAEDDYHGGGDIIIITHNPIGRNLPMISPVLRPSVRPWAALSELYRFTRCRPS